MALSDEQKTKIETNINRLDYLKGTGVISAKRKHLANEMFVFIGTGGVGCKALAKLKQTIINQVDVQDVEKQTMFLAIDTAWKELDESVEKEDFKKSEVLKVPFEGAHDSINPEKILPQIKEWVHEELWRVTGGEAVMSKEFNGTGAGAIRQCGRVLFSQSAVQYALYDHLSKIPAYLAKMGGTPTIKVFFLAGISGGTGSGTILDLTFLTRHFLKNILKAAQSNVIFSGYLFLPSACGNAAAMRPDEIANGDCNAYAALKEIDYYMTLTNRTEHFVMNYGTINASNVDIADNVFDFCTLVEGVGDGGRFYKNNAEISRQIVAESILNIICADNRQTTDGNQAFLVDSFLSNQTAQSNIRIERHSDLLWPRDSNYIYSVIGFSSCIVPIDLLTIYVTKKIFDEVYGKYLKAEEADEEAAIIFLKKCGLELRDLEQCYGNLTKGQLLHDIQAQADEEFKAWGPYYMVNLVKEAVQLIEDAPEDYLHKAQKKENGFLKRDKWKKIVSYYGEAAKYLRKINNELYEIYSYVITVLKELFERNAKLLTDTKEYEEQFGKAFYWSPIDMTPGEQASTAVAEYLDEMLDKTAVQNIAKKFVDELCERKEEWTQLEAPEGQVTAKFNVAKVIREFIAENLKQCTNTTLEEFLVKAYSGKKDALVYENNPISNKEVCSKDTKVAAEKILDRLSNNASALAVTKKDFQLDDCYSNIYLTLPADCKWLYEAVSEIAGHYHIGAGNIYKTSAQDRVVFCRLYTGVPLWALYWTADAEEHYEGSNGEGPKKIGLHIDQGKNGLNWSELPNLYPERLWSPTQRKLRLRESDISESIRRNMHCAQELFMLTEDRSNAEYYNLVLLKDEKNAEKLLKKADLDPAKKYELGEILHVLMNKGEMQEFKINYANMVMTTTDTFDEKELKHFHFELACRTLRRFHREYQRLEETIPVVEQLRKGNEEREVIAVPDPEKITLFLESLKWELLVYDGRRNTWKLVLEDEEILGDELSNKFEQICAHYYGFRAFSNLDAEELELIQERINELKEEAKDEEFDRIDMENSSLRNSLETLRRAKKKDVKPWPEVSPFKSANASAWPMATQDFVDRVGDDRIAKAIRDFYTELINNM